MKPITKFSLSCVVGLLTCVSAATAQAPQDSILAVYDSLELKGVTVTAAKPLVKMEADKMTYDVQGDADAQSATVLDMLRKVPMVTVDGQDNITVNGSSAFKVYVDGKPNPMFSQNPSQVFKMMPAAAVEKIEVITNPGAKYDAEGAVGVLNLVLARQQGGGAAPSLDGITGTLRAMASNRGAGGGAFLSAKQGKLSATANAFYQYQHTNNLSIDLDRENHPASATSSSATTSPQTLSLHQHQKAKQRMPFTMGSLNLAYDLDSLNVMSASFGITTFQAKLLSTPAITMEQEDGLVAYNYDSRTRIRNIAINASADWQHFFSPNHRRFLTLSYLLTYTPQKTRTQQNYDDYFDYDHFADNRPKSLEQTLQADYTTPLATGHTLNVGAKYIMRNNKSWAENRTLMHETLQSLSQFVEYRHTNDIAAAYAEYEAKVGKFGAKAGLRYEHTWQDVDYKQGNGSDFKKNYGNLVPSVSLSLSPQMTKNIGLTYNMRLSRPGITYLNPYVDRSNPTVITYGNPDLDVAKTHNLGLTFSSFSQKFMLNAGLHQSFSNNQLSEYSFYEDGMLNTTFANIARERNTSLTAFVNWLATAKTRLMLNGGLTYADLRTDDEKNHGWQANLMLGLQQTLPWQLRLSLNAITNSRTYTLQGHTSGFQLGVMSLTKSLLNKRLNVTLTGITGLGHGGKLRIDTTTRGLDFLQRQRISIPVQQVQLTLSYTFGNQRLQVKQHKTRIENDFTEKKSEQEQVGGATGM